MIGLPSMESLRFLSEMCPALLTCASSAVRKTDSPHAAEVAANAEPGDEGRLEDVVRFAKFSGITWLHDDSGFFYQRFPTKELDHGLDDTDDTSGTGTTKDENAMLFFHKLGTSQSDDVLVYRNTDQPEYMFSTDITDDGKYLILDTYRDTAPSALTWVTEVSKLDLSSREAMSKIEWKKIVDKFGAQYSCIANDDSKLYFMTNDKAPRYKLVTYDLSKPDEVGRSGVVEKMRADSCRLGLCRPGCRRPRLDPDFGFRCQRERPASHPLARRQRRADGSRPTNGRKEGSDRNEPHRLVRSTDGTTASHRNLLPDARLQ